MIPNQDTINLRPLKVVEILDRALWLLRNHLVDMLKLALFGACTQVLTNGGLFPDSMLLTVVGALIGICLSIYVNIGVMYYAQGCWLGLPTTIGSAFSRFRFRILLKSVLCGILIGIGTLFFALFLIIPGIIFLGNRVLAGYEILFYDSPVRKSLKKSKWLMTQKSWYSTSGPMMRLSGLWVILIIVTWVFAILSLVFMGLITGASLSTFATQTGITRTITSILTGFVTGLTTIFNSLVMIGFYYDLRVRYEGTDLLAKIDSLAHKEPVSVHGV